MDILYNTVYKANGVNNSLIAVSYIQYVDFLIKSEKRKKIHNSKIVQKSRF